MSGPAERIQLRPKMGRESGGSSYPRHEEIPYTLRRELSWSYYRLIEEDFRRLMFAAEKVWA